MGTTPIISGAFATQVGKLVNSSCLALHDEAAFGAIRDADLDPREIDGVICAYSLTEPHLMLASWFCEYAGLAPKVCYAVQAGGATGAIMLTHAANLIETGTCRNVLVVAGDNRLTGFAGDGAVAALSQVGHPQFERPYYLSIPAAYGLVATRYMHEHGVDDDDLAAVAVAMRANAANHPGAHKSDPITIRDVSESPMIASPLRRLDCSLISDGGGALVVSAESRGRSVEILGTGQGHTHEHIVAAPSIVEFACKQSSEIAFDSAGVNINDIDVAQIYDSFTITLLVELESIGFFEPGTAGSAIANGALQSDGSLPCNTHGGLLSHGHPGAAGGLFHVIEAVTQLRNEAGTRQVKDAELAFVHGDGGILSAHCSLVLGRG